MVKQTLSDIDMRNRRVLVRVDFNVPVKDNAISDDSRIRAVIPTIEYLQKQGAKIVLCSHLGRPEGKVVPSMSLKPVAIVLSRLLGTEVKFIDDCIGTSVTNAVSELSNGEVILLENLRFHKEEENNDSGFAQELSSLADIFVNDGFAVAHRAHASTEGITHYIPSVAGFLMNRELEILGTLLKKPDRPLVVLLGGAKVSDKIGVLENFIRKVNVILICGGMAATFLKAAGFSIGASPTEDNLVELAKDISRRAEDNKVSFHIPTDVVIAESFSADSKNMTVQVIKFPKDGS
jgi:phosphoglycerate kinase